MHLNFRRVLLLSFVIAGNPEAEDGSNKLEGLKIGLKYGIALYKDTKYKDFFFQAMLRCLRTVHRSRSRRVAFVTILEVRQTACT